MKGYNFNRAENGAYSDNPEVIDNNTSDRNTEYELPGNRCVYGDMQGTPFILVVGPEGDDYDGYEDVTKFYMEYYEYYTSVVVKMGDDDDPNNRQYTIEYYDANGRIGTHYADVPEVTASGTAMGVNHDGRSHNAYQAENRQGIDESRQDGEWFYEYSSSGDPIWSGPEEGMWDASEVLIVAPTAQPPSRWPDGAIVETTLDTTIDESVPNNLCPGDTVEATVQMSNDHVASDIIGQIQYKVIGSSPTTQDFVIGPGETESIDIRSQVGENAFGGVQEVLSIDIASDADVKPNVTEAFTATVGTQPDQVLLENVELPSEAVAGRELAGSVDVRNEGSCSASVTVRQYEGQPKDSGSSGGSGGTITPDPIEPTPIEPQD